MIGNPLRTPTGSTSEATFQRGQKDAVERSRINDTPGARVNRTTRGVVIEYDSTKQNANDNDKRLFTFFNESGTALGDVTTLDGFDCGTVIPGWTAAVETSIKEALRTGKRVKTTAVLQMTVEQVTPSTISEADFKLHFYTGSASYSVSMQVPLPATAQSSVYLFSFSGELTQAISGTSCTYKEHAVFLGSQQIGATIGDFVPYRGGIGSGHATGSVTNAANGKIIGAVELAENCNANLKLRCLTIDALPAL